MAPLRGLLRVVHWGPLLALSIIATISIFAVYCSLQWWPIESGPGAVVNLTMLFVWQLLILYNFFSAMYVGPGNVPFGWTPKDEADKRSLQYCTYCEGHKVPRSHHCRKCQRCVMKMDHHCPWINNCVGHRNHASFTAFLIFAPCGCLHGACVIIPAVYRAVNREMLGAVEPGLMKDEMSLGCLMLSLVSLVFALGTSLAMLILLFVQPFYIAYGDGSEPMVYLGLYGIIISMFAIGMAIGVTLAVGGLFFLQMKSIVNNETGVETWIKSKAAYRDRAEDEPEFIYPYDVGSWQNLRNVFYWGHRPELNGIWWPVHPECTQFTLTLEQIAQKHEKRDRSVVYTVRTVYSGTICPLLWGPRVFFCAPCTDEPRIRVSMGDTVRVTRWKRHWLYGDKITSVDTPKELKRIRGWFPRKCAVEFFSNDHHGNAAGDVYGGKAPEEKKLD